MGLGVVISERTSVMTVMVPFFKIKKYLFISSVIRSRYLFTDGMAEVMMKVACAKHNCARPHSPRSVSWINFIYVIFIHQIYETVLNTKWSSSLLEGMGQARRQEGRRAQKSPETSLSAHLSRLTLNPISMVQFPQPDLITLSSKPHPSSFIYLRVCVQVSSSPHIIPPSIPLCISPKPSSAPRTRLSIWNDYWMKCFQLCLRGLRMVFYSPLQLLLSGSHLVLSTLTSSPHLSLLLTAV